MLAACTSPAPEAPEDTRPTPAPEPVETVEEEEPAVDADVVIVSGQFDPADLTIPVDTQSLVTVINQDEFEYRIDFMVYGTEDGLTLGPGESGEIALNPALEGRFPILLNTQQVGTVLVE